MSKNRILEYYALDSQEIDVLLVEALRITQSAILVSTCTNCDTNRTVRLDMKIIESNQENAVSNLLITFTKHGLKNLLKYADKQKIILEYKLASQEESHDALQVCMLMKAIHSLLAFITTGTSLHIPKNITSDTHKLHYDIGHLNGLRQLIIRALNRLLSEN